MACSGHELFSIRRHTNTRQSKLLKECIMHIYCMYMHVSIVHGSEVNMIFHCRIADAIIKIQDIPLIQVLERYY